MTNIISTPHGQLVVIHESGVSSVISAPTTPQVVISNLAPQPNPRTIEVKIISDATNLTAGDLFTFCIPSDFDGLNLIDADAFVTTASSSGTPTINLRNDTQGAVNMLSTPITIDVSETTSYTAAVQPVIDAANDDVVTGDFVTVVVSVIGTGTKGLGVILRFG